MRLFVLKILLLIQTIEAKKITSGAPYIAESQGQFYSAIDLGELAAELDTMERRRMAEVTDLPSHKMFLFLRIFSHAFSVFSLFCQMGEDSAEYRAFIQQPSANMDDSGFFSVQVF